MSHDFTFLFSENGPLAAAVDGYRARPLQTEMAQAVADAIQASTVLVAEAGTGTGKTFAYLVPALLSGGKVVISTGTKTLQDQLFDRDIPTVRAALKVPVTIALLKGRANYVCHYHLERVQAEGRLVRREDAAHLSRIARFAATSTTGDKSDLAEVPEHAGIWPSVTSTRDNCLGSNCPHYGKCFVMEARRQALAADVVVVNHHLFFADVMLRDEGVAELLPACNTVIFDEAHQLPETASLFFGESTSTSQLIELARDSRLEAAATAKDFVALPEGAAALDKAARDLRLSLRETNARMTLGTIAGNQAFTAALATAAEKLDVLVQLLESQAERGEGLRKCWQRATALREQIGRWRDDDDDDRVRWLEVFSHALQLNATPLSIADVFRRQVDEHARAWIFTSATLAVGGDFSHYCGELGLADAHTVAWESPFDFAHCALLYAPRGMPAPNTPAYTPAVIETALPLIAASRGGIFLLFTSLRAMREGYELLRTALIEKDIDRPLLTQDDGPRSELLERFRRLGNAILLGSHSFWEGVDVRGDALSVVIIDKLPFAPPDDPVLAARIERMRRAGRNAFAEYQLPQAVITLKQGAGRLIRDETDRGVLAICDPRLIAKSYGRKIIRSLPPMRVTREAKEVTAFLADAKPVMDNSADAVAAASAEGQVGKA
ncbi:MAG TPA: ATP-dependent DNA helicase [Burkholderiales bacterium]|nr:ATP-dependent DNA helicase [Burkholderiales bacterium]